MTGCLPVKIAGHFIGKQYGRPADKGAGDGNPLLFAAGQLVRVVGCTGSQPDLCELFLRQFPGITVSGQFQRQHDVFQGGQTGQ